MISIILALIDVVAQAMSLGRTDDKNLDLICRLLGLLVAIGALVLACIAVGQNGGMGENEC